MSEFIDDLGELRVKSTSAGLVQEGSMGGETSTTSSDRPGVVAVSRICTMSLVKFATAKVNWQPAIRPIHHPTTPPSGYYIDHSTI